MTNAGARLHQQMQRDAFLNRIRQQLQMPEADADRLEQEAIRCMEAAGYRVLLDRTTDHRYRVRVQHRATAPEPRGKGHNRVWDYNVATTSTSGYPILTAFEKWQSRKGADDA